jgi:membrane associated rhomboid family serine protease
MSGEERTSEGGQTMTIERHRGTIRFGLIYLAVTVGVVAAWILIAPKGFYDEFPGGTHAWASALPPYNEHLERDFGAAGLGLAVLAVLAAVWMERRLVQAAAIVLFVGSAPHLAYHLTTTGSYSAFDNVASLGGLALQTMLPLLLLYLASDRAQAEPAGSALARDQVPGAA